MDKHFVRFFNCSLPVSGCNLRCDYCYLIQRGDEKSLDFKESNEGLKYPVAHMLKALTPDRLGGICAFHICADGETLLWSDIIEFSKGLFEMGHFVSFTSNCTVTNKILEFTSFPEEYRERMFFKCSFHYREFKRLGLLERFTQNVNYLAKAGISYSVEIVTNDYILENIDEIKDFSMRHFGALPHVLTQRSELIKGKYPRMGSIMDREVYADTWGQFHSDLFDYQLDTFDCKHNEFCYAGVYSLQMHLEDGNVFPCPGNNRKIMNLFENIEMPITFLPVGHNCPLDNCWFEFVTHILGGDNRGLCSDIYFKNFRSRVRTDNGKNWLSNTMMEAYGHRCSEYHEPLTSEAELFIDSLMKVAYKHTEPDKETNERCATILTRKLTELQAEKIIIYGMGAVGEWLKKLLSSHGVCVVCGIDRNFKNLHSDIPIVNMTAHIPEADLIIVSAYGEFHEIYKRIRENIEIPVISVADIV